MWQPGVNGAGKLLNDVTVTANEIPIIVLICSMYATKVILEVQVKV